MPSWRSQMVQPEQTDAERARLRAEAAVDAVAPDRVVELLRPFLTEARAAKIERVLARRTLGVVVAIEAPSDPHNAAAVVRTAEALGVLGVHVVAVEGRALHTRSTTQGAFRWVDTHHHAALAGLLAFQRRRGLRLCGAAMDGSIPVSRIPVDEPVCLLLGNEQRGLSDQARTACDTLFHVPMVGMSESLNLSVTAAIAMHDVLGRRPAVGLDAATEAHWRARYFARSLDPRLVLGLLHKGEGTPAR